MTDRDTPTPPETPDAHRWSIPEMDVHEGATPKELSKLLADTIFKIATNLEAIRSQAHANLSLENVNAYAIRRMVEQTNGRIDAIVGRRWGRVLQIKTERLRLVAATTFFCLMCFVVGVIVTLAILRR